MKKILMTLTVMAITACMAFGQTNWGKAVMYDSRTGKFLDPVVVLSNQIVTVTNTTPFMGTQTFYAITLGGVTRTNWPSGGTWGAVTGTLSNQVDLWVELTNRYTKGEINGFGFLTNIPSYYVTNGMNVSVLVNNVGFLTNIPSYYVTNGMTGVNFSSLTVGGAPVQVVSTNYITGFAVEGASAKITVGNKGFFRVPTSGNIIQWVMRADNACTVVVDIAKSPAVSFPVASSIVAGAPMLLDNQQCLTNTTLTGWTTGVTAGDYLKYSVLTNSSATNLAIELTISVP